MNNAKVFRAINFAVCKHAGQLRKASSFPYVTHPINVAATLIEVGGVVDEDVLCAAILHDTIEDTNTTFEELELLFGKEVASTVKEVTDDKRMSKVQRKKAQIEHAKVMSEGAQQIKIADKIDNCRSLIETPPPNWKSEEIVGYAVWSRAVVAAMPGSFVELENMLFALVDKIVGFDADGAEAKYQQILDRYYEICSQ